MEEIEMQEDKKTLLQNVDCISMYVDDLDKGIEFYSDKLGLKLLWRVDGSCGLSMSDDITEVVLCNERNPIVDFKVDSVEQAIKEFENAGGKIEYGPFDINIGKCAVVSDPWGNEFCILDMSKGTYDTDENGNVTGVSKKS